MAWRVLIVEDAETVKTALTEIFATDRDFRVSATCDSGMQATRLSAAIKPDLITLDLVLPDIDGVETIRNIMAHSPTRIVVVSGRADVGQSPIAMDALRAGALEVFAKNTLLLQRAQFLQRVRGLCELPPPPKAGGATEPLGVPRAPVAPVSTSDINVKSLGLGPLPPRLIVIGASTGGPAVIERLLSSWPKSFALPVVVAQHMTDGFNRDLVNWLASRTSMRVKTAAEGEELHAGTAYFAPDRRHIKIGPGGYLSLEEVSGDALSCPSVDKLFFSAAEHSARSTIGVLLTGMGDDGAKGLQAIRDAGGRTVAQDRSTSLVFGMPNAAIKLDAARIVLPTDEIAQYLLDRSARPPS